MATFVKKSAAPHRSPAKKSALSPKALRAHLLKDGPDAIRGIDFVSSPERPAYDPQKRVTPVIARRWNVGGWIYETPSEARFCMYANLVGFNQVAFDTFVEEQRWDSPVAKKNLLWVLALRTQALSAFKAKNYPLMRANFETLNLYRQFLEEDGRLRDVAKLGLKFKQGRKPGAIGQVRKAITRALKANPQLKTEGVWKELKDHRPRGFEFYGVGKERYIWTESQGVTTWHRFQTIVSEEKAKLRG